MSSCSGQWPEKTSKLSFRFETFRFCMILHLLVRKRLIIKANPRQIVLRRLLSCTQLQKKRPPCTSDASWLWHHLDGRPRPRPARDPPDFAHCNASEWCRAGRRAGSDDEGNVRLRPDQSPDCHVRKDRVGGADVQENRGTQDEGHAGERRYRAHQVQEHISGGQRKGTKITRKTSRQSGCRARLSETNSVEERVTRLPTPSRAHGHVPATC